MVDDFLEDLLAHGQSRLAAARGWFLSIQLCKRCTWRYSSCYLVEIELKNRSYGISCVITPFFMEIY